MLLFETELGMTNEAADAQYALWSGVCYVTPLLGGWVADSYLGERDLASSRPDLMCRDRKSAHE